MTLTEQMSVSRSHLNVDDELLWVDCEVLDLRMHWDDFCTFLYFSDLNLVSPLKADVLLEVLKLLQILYRMTLKIWQLPDLRSAGFCCGYIYCIYLTENDYLYSLLKKKNSLVSYTAEKPMSYVSQMVCTDTSLSSSFSTSTFSVINNAWCLFYTIPFLCWIHNGAIQ